MPIDPHGPGRRRRARPLAGAVVSTVPLVLLPFAVNVASDSMPGGAQRWAWLSWPAILILVVLSWRLGATTTDAPPDTTPQPGADFPAGPNATPGTGSRWAGRPPAGPSATPGTGTGWAAARSFPWPPPGDAPLPPTPIQAPGAAWGRPARVPAPAVRRVPSRSLRGLAVPVAGSFTGVLLGQFHLIGVHAPFLAAGLIVIIALVLCLAEVITPPAVPRGTAAALTYTVGAGAAVLRWDSSRADLWLVAESAVILGLGVFLATRVRDPRFFRRVLPGVVLAVLGWCAMGVLFAIYQSEETVVANAAFFACLSAVVAGAIAAAQQALADPDVAQRRR